MEVTIIPFDSKYLAETLAMMRHWSPDHPELGERSLYDWQRCSRYLALAGGKVVGHIAQIAHEFRYANGRTPVKLGWGITLVLDMSDDATRKAAGRQLLKACEDAPGLNYAAVVREILPARKGPGVLEETGGPRAPRHARERGAPTAHPGSVRHPRADHALPS